MELTIEEAVKLISYPPRYPLHFPPQNKFLDKLYAQKIFTLKSFIISHCVDSKEMEKKFDFSSEEHLRVLIHEFSTLMLPTGFEKVSKLLISTRGSVIRIDCDSINDLLDGGLRLRHLTEISGESGSGKSNLCLQYLLSAQLPPEYGGLDGNSVYITAESDFGEKRIEQMSQGIIERKIKGFEKSKDLMDNILVNSAATLQDLEDTFFIALPKLLEGNGSIRIVVLDSIASIFRVEFGMNDHIRRSEAIFKLASQMKYLSSKYAFAMVVVNQVSAVISDDPTVEKSQPALGLGWASCVDTRLICKKKTNSQPIVRSLKVGFSSYLKNDTEAEFVIENDGIKNLLD
jgi:DNA-repair protein XRCC3